MTLAAGKWIKSFCEVWQNRKLKSKEGVQLKNENDDWSVICTDSCDERGVVDLRHVGFQMQIGIVLIDI